MSYYWVNLNDIIPLSAQEFTALEEWIEAHGCKIAIAINNDAAPLDREFQKDVDEEAEAQGVTNLLTMQQQSGATG